MTPLHGKRIVCTGSPGSDASLIEFLTGEGAEVLQYPCIAIDPVADSSDLDRALADAAQGVFAWVCFTSSNAVEQVADRCRETGIDFPRARIAAIGTSTGRAIHAALTPGRELVRGTADVSPPHPQPLSTGVVDWPWNGLTGGEGSTGLLETNAIFIPSTFTAAAFADELPIAPGDTVLIPQADIAAPTLADVLRARGATVSTVTAYRTTTGSGGVDLPALLIQRAVDAVLFASPSAVTGCLERFAREGGDPGVLASVPIVCIGPVTAAAARARRLSSLVISPEHTRSGMANTLIAEFAAHREETRA